MMVCGTTNFILSSIVYDHVEEGQMEGWSLTHLFNVGIQKRTCTDHLVCVKEVSDLSHDGDLLQTQTDRQTDNEEWHTSWSSTSPVALLAPGLLARSQDYVCNETPTRLRINQSINQYQSIKTRNFMRWNRFSPKTCNRHHSDYSTYFTRPGYVMTELYNPSCITLHEHVWTVFICIEWNTHTLVAILYQICKRKQEKH